MTLSEMAEYVCEVYGKTDTSTVASCKKYLQHRHRMICDSALWRDMIGVFTTPTKDRVVYLPQDADRAIAVVFDQVNMDVNDLIRDAIVNPQNISTADTEQTLSTGTEAVMADAGVRVKDGVLQIQDPDTLLWYDAVIRSDGGAPAVSVEGAGEAT